MEWIALKRTARGAQFLLSVVPLQAGPGEHGPADLPHVLPVQPSAAPVAAAHLRQTVLHAVVSPCKKTPQFGNGNFNYTFELYYICYRLD